MNYATRKTLSKHDQRCEAPECGNKVYARRLCARHYNRDQHQRANAYRFGGHEGVVKTGVKGWGSV